MSAMILSHIPQSATKKMYGGLARATFAGITALWHISNAARDLYAALYVRSK